MDSVLDSVFEEGGWLSQLIPGYHLRPGQAHMAKAVEDAIYDRHHVLADAPTGTGKSMAYGIPAAIYALLGSRTVVVATANITLQEQLFRKDFPLIAQLFEGAEDEDGEELPDLKIHLMKGMGNYLCLDRYRERVRRKGSKLPDELIRWAEETETGDKNELKEDYSSKKHHNVWAKVNANPDDCSRGHCQFFDSCFIFKARNMESQPHIIITNYHMLYTDFSVRTATEGATGFLPNYEVLVMDEAHDAVDIAMSFQGFEYSVRSFNWVMRRLEETGETEAYSYATAIERVSRAVFENLADYRCPQENDLIIRKPIGDDRGFVTVLESAAQWVEQYRKKQSKLSKAQKFRHQLFSVALLKRAHNLRMTFFGESREVGETKFMALPQGKVYFVNKDSKGEATLCCKAVEVQPFLRENAFEPKIVICTSATMTTGEDNFKFISKEMGLEERERKDIKVPSPFDDQRVLFVVPRDLPDPAQKDDHMKAVAKVVEEIVKDIGGKTMALFTSYRALNFAAEYLQKRLQGIEILVQGVMQKPHMIEAFKRTPNALILATASFWEGVDIPGQALSCLVIDKFPFLTPEDPVLKYTADKLECEEGGDGSLMAFLKYSLPKAIIALKQGVGRLIRTESDYGAVVICDPRFYTRRYGSQFRRALPRECCEGDKPEDVKAFLGYWEKHAQQS